MNKKVWFVLLLLGGVISSGAQNIQLSIANDSTFNAADDNAKTSSGFDVDITKLNVVNLGMQVAQDAVVSNANNGEVTSALPNKSYYQQRFDLMLWSALPERTNVYSTVAFLNTNSGASSTKAILVNMEVEHFFNNHFKFRVGRLSGSVSESQFFGRMALEESSAHIFGRKLFINDALEFDGNFLNQGGPVFFIGFKPRFKPFNLKGIYTGIHQPFKGGLQIHGIFSVNRQFETDLQKYIPEFNGTQVYFSYEGEIAYKRKGSSLFLNVGGNLNYKGLIPHTSGNFDFMSQLTPVVTSSGDSFKETFTPSCGYHLLPSKLSSSWKFLPQVGVEAEVQGLLTNRFTALNVCAYCRVSITRRMVLTYFCTPQFVWQDFNETKPSYIGGMVNYLRLSVTIGKPTRMFL